jgi:hypothetical protein
MGVPQLCDRLSLPAKALDLSLVGERSGP